MWRCCVACMGTHTERVRLVYRTVDQCTVGLRLVTRCDIVGRSLNIEIPGPHPKSHSQYQEPTQRPFNKSQQFTAYYTVMLMHWNECGNGRVVTYRSGVGWTVVTVDQWPGTDAVLDVGAQMSPGPSVRPMFTATNVWCRRDGHVTGAAVTRVAGIVCHPHRAVSAGDSVSRRHSARPETSRHQHMVTSVSITTTNVTVSTLNYQCHEQVKRTK